MRSALPRANLIRLRDTARAAFTAAGLVGLLVAACNQPNNQGRRPVTEDAGPDQQSEPPERGPDPDAAGTPPDRAAGMAVPVADAGGAAAIECTAGARVCLPADRQATRSCSEAGQWVDGPRCAAGRSCSGGSCVCDEGACEDGVLLQMPGYVEDLVGGAEQVHYVHREPTGRSAIHSAVVGTGVASAPLYPPAGYEIAPGLAADATDIPTWCRGRQEPTITGDLMKGTMPLERAPCAEPRLSDRHIYFTVGTEVGLFRRALARPGRQRVFADTPYGVEVTASHIYLSHFSNGIVLSRIPVEDLGNVQMLGRRAESPGRMFDRIAVDSAHVYVSYADQVLRIALEGGNSFDDIWSHRGPEVDSIRLTDTHVYWATLTQGVETCSEAAFWRRSKLRDDRAILLARRPAACPRGLAIIGDRVYAAVSAWPGPSQILRLHR
jgi:hypothetical protein